MNLTLILSSNLINICYFVLRFLDKARVSFVPTHQYIPRGLQGMIKCHVLANPRVQFVTWTKNKRIYDPFEEEGVMALPNGTILIDKVCVVFYILKHTYI